MFIIIITHDNINLLMTVPLVKITLSEEYIMTH